MGKYVMLFLSAAVVALFVIALSTISTVRKQEDRIAQLGEDISNRGIDISYIYSQLGNFMDYSCESNY